MNIHEKLEIIKKKFKPSGRPGCVDNIFEIYERAEKDESGFLPVIVIVTPEEKKSRKSIN